MSERGFFSASNDIKTLDGNIFSGFPWLTTHLQGLWKRRTGLSRDFLQNEAWYELLRIRAFTPTHRHFAPLLKFAKKIAPCSQWKPRWHGWCGWNQHDCFWIYNEAKSQNKTKQSKAKQSKAKENKSNTNKTKHLLTKQNKTTTTTTTKSNTNKTNHLRFNS